jgi:5-methylcytosine-specific restriction endonuclease McrA
MSHHDRRMIWTAATDRTFRLQPARPGRVATVVGKCIHCNSKLSMLPTGERGPSATLEHIFPRTHGGTHALTNLAIACRRCNGSKAKLDRRHLSDPTLQRVIARLQERRADRWRSPPPDWDLPPLPDGAGDVPGQTDE